MSALPLSPVHSFFWSRWLTAVVFATIFSVAQAQRETPTRPTAPRSNAPVAPSRSIGAAPVMLGIDVLEADGFTAVKGKRIGLLTHAAGVNRRGIRTVDILHRAPGVNLVALFAVEHGITGEGDAEKPFEDSRDPRSGLPVLSLYTGRGKKFRPTPQQLRRIDALVVDLQDIGVRSYTYSGAMKTAMEACFAAGKEVIILDRPNPLGGLKVSGPILDEDLMSDVGRFCVPYVHGLTMGELARYAVGTPAPSGLSLSKTARARAKLTVIPMRGWRRDMRWPETGLTFVPPSQKIEDFAAVVGYAMIGLGCEYSGFVHAIGDSPPFRGVYYRNDPSRRVAEDLRALKIQGLAFVPLRSPDRNGQLFSGVRVDVIDWAEWNPTELSFELMRLACRYDGSNPFRKLTRSQMRTFNIHVGSSDWLESLRRQGARVNLEAYQRRWDQAARDYQQRTRRFWLYD